MIIVIFGASGDLAKRKLFPSLSKINLDNTKIIGYSRANLENTFIDKLKEYYKYDDSFFDKITYVSGQYDDLSPLYGYKDEEIMFYFSLPPKVYKTLLNALKVFKRGSIAIEKPYGYSLENFNEIENFIHTVPNFKIYLVDHYLLKPMCVSLPLLEFKKKRFDGLLNKKYIKSIEIISNEQLGIEGRAYFDDVGIVKDILQNHLLEFFCTVFADFGSINSQDDIARSRLEIKKNLKVLEDKMLFGQYRNYITELEKDSLTETYALFVLNHNTEEFDGIPIIMYGGKGLQSKKTEIKVGFKQEFFKKIIENVLEDKMGNDDTKICEKYIDAVDLIFNMAPNNRIDFVVKVMGKEYTYNIVSTEEIKNKKSDVFGDLSDHELIFDSFIKGNEFPSTHLEEARKEWEIFNIDSFRKNKRLFFYDKGERIPKEAEDMIKEVIGE